MPHLMAGVVLLLLAGALVWLLDQLGIPNPFAVSGVAVICVPIVVFVFYRFDVHLIGYFAVAVLSYLAGVLTSRYLADLLALRRRGARPQP